MTKETRYRLGKLWKEKKTSGDYETYYNEFKDQIDGELFGVKEVVAEEHEEVEDIPVVTKSRRGR